MLPRVLPPLRLQAGAFRMYAPRAMRLSAALNESECDKIVPGQRARQYIQYAYVIIGPEWEGRFSISHER